MNKIINFATKGIVASTLRYNQKQKIIALCQIIAKYALA